MGVQGMPETREGAMELLEGLMSREGLRGFYELLGEVHRRRRGAAELPDEFEHGAAEAGTQVASRLLELAETVERDGAVWEARNETYAEYAAGVGLELFWLIIAALVPQAKTGDLSPDASAELSRAAASGVSQWIEFNAPPGVAANMLG